MNRINHRNPAPRPIRWQAETEIPRAARRSAGRGDEAIRRYSMAWLLRAACRVTERGMRQQAEHRHMLRSAGMTGLFDLSDIATAPACGESGSGQPWTAAASRGQASSRR